MEIRQRDRALARRTCDVHERTERGQRDAHVGRSGRNAGTTRAKDRMATVEAVDRRAAAAGTSLVAGRRRIIEVTATRTLHQIAAG